MDITDLMDRHGFVPADHHAPRFFPVDLVPLTAAGNAAPGWRALVRTDTGQLLHCWPDGYRLVPHEAACAAFDTALAASRLDTRGLRVATDLTHDGRRLFRQYILPAHQVEIRPGDATALRLVGFNSYDGSLAVSWRGGGYRFVCANTAVIGRDIACARARHSAGLDMAALAHGMVAACELYLAETGRWAAWARVRLATDQAVRLLRALPGAGDALLGQLTAAWVGGREDDTLWALFNILTHWATHEPVRGANRMARVQARQERVARLIDGRTWRRLEDEAGSQVPCGVAGPVPSSR
ncbi:DUF932 domain-containing protein [Azospirillum picis]|uniref:DUF932 domain-containing protein n=1 Tax=Azospirillum picis TaxID=488438 RepID=A0ABU0MV29_9PROT|nr:DUF932 domain-containing protein [Azospirillum picis]MBP2300929.1 hypothetical protein [Azospirillum picis]MDQ0537033.1 hypothetical protein [Azospirillum picis]